MILTGNQIKKEIRKGRIHISPFRDECIQPNGYDFHLGEELIRYPYNNAVESHFSENLTIPKTGLELKPNEFYLGITEEVTASNYYSQLLYGNKSIGSIGVWVQVSAPLAHIGSHIRWTLEIRVIKNTILYPGMKIGKICFLKNFGKRVLYSDKQYWNSGRYTEDKIMPSLISLDIPLKDNNN